MVTTTLTAFEATNSTGSRHVQFSLYNSTPDSGSVEDGMGDWYVVRSGSIIHRWRGLIGGWATIDDGDIVYAKYTDGAGNSGAFASYTFSISSSWDLTYYVDATSGSDSNDGSSTILAKQTFANAYTTYTAARSAGQKARILLKRGETFTSTGMSTTNWVSLGSTTGHLYVGSYGSGADPAITLTTSGNGSILAGGQLGAMSLTLESLDVTGAGSGTSSQFCNFNSTPIAASTEANIVIIGCTATGCDAVYVGPYSGATSGAWANETGRVDYHAMIGCTFDDWGAGLAGHAFTNISSVAYMLMVDCAWLRQQDANGFIRLNAPRYSAFINNTFDRSNTTFKYNVFRVAGGEDTAADDACKRCLISGNTFIDCNEGIEIDLAQHAWDFSYEDLDILDNSFTQSAAINYPISIGGADDNTSHRLTRFRVIGNQSTSDWLPLIGIVVGGSVTDTGHIESVLIANNTSVVRGSSGLGALLNVSGSSTARVDADSITLYNNFACGTGSGGMFISDGGGAITESKIVASNYNHFVCNGGTANWTGSTSLATWDDGGKDVNSSASNGGVHNLTDTSFATFDAHPSSGTGPQIGTGNGTVWIDADGNLFVDDAGAFEYGGAAPDSPVGGATATPEGSVVTLTIGTVTAGSTAVITKTTANYTDGSATYLLSARNSILSNGSINTLRGAWWFISYNNTVLYRHHGLEWVHTALTDGETVDLLLVDETGQEIWATPTTLSVGSTFAWRKWVNASTGTSGGTGEENDPFDTIPTALAALRAAYGTVAAEFAEYIIELSDETHDHGTVTNNFVWNQNTQADGLGTSFPGRLTFRGAGSNCTVLVPGSSSGVCSNARINTGFASINVNWQGDYTLGGTHSGYFIQNSRTVADGAGLNVTVCGGSLTGFFRHVNIESPFDGTTEADVLTGDFDWVSIQDVTFGQAYAYHCGLFYAAKIGVHRCTFGPLGGSGTGSTFRMGFIVDCSFGDLTIDRSDSGTYRGNCFRINGNLNSGGSKRVSISKLNFINTYEGIEFEQPGGASILSDYWIYGCVFDMQDEGNDFYPISISLPGANTYDITNLRITACSSITNRRGIGFLNINTYSSATSGKIHSIAVEHCSTYMTGAGGSFSYSSALINGAGVNFDTGCLTLKGNFSYCADSYTDGSHPVSLIKFGSTNAWEMLAESDYNVLVRRSNGGGLGWDNSTSLATWTGTYGLDLHSYTGFNQTIHDFTSIASGSVNFALASGNGAQIGRGYPGLVYADPNRGLFDTGTAPDAGAYQYNVSTLSDPVTTVNEASASDISITLGTAQSAITTNVGTYSTVTIEVSNPTVSVVASPQGSTTNLEVGDPTKQITASPGSSVIQITIGTASSGTSVDVTANANESNVGISTAAPNVSTGSGLTVNPSESNIGTTVGEPTVTVTANPESSTVTVTIGVPSSNGSTDVDVEGQSSTIGIATPVVSSISMVSIVENASEITSSSTSPTVITGTAAIIQANAHISSISVTAPEITSVTTTRNPTGSISIQIEVPNNPSIPPSDTEHPSVFVRVEGSANNQFFTSDVINYSLDDANRLLTNLNNINRDVGRLPTGSRVAWVSTVLNNVEEPASNKAIIKIMTNDYNKFKKPGNSIGQIKKP